MLEPCAQALTLLFCGFVCCLLRYTELMATEGVQLTFEQEALEKIGAFGCIQE